MQLERRACLYCTTARNSTWLNLVEFDWWVDYKVMVTLYMLYKTKTQLLLPSIRLILFK